MTIFSGRKSLWYGILLSDHVCFFLKDLQVMDDFNVGVIVPAPARGGGASDAVSRCSTILSRRSVRTVIAVALIRKSYPFPFWFISSATRWFSIREVAGKASPVPTNRSACRSRIRRLIAN